MLSAVIDVDHLHRRRRPPSDRLQDLESRPGLIFGGQSKPAEHSADCWPTWLPFFPELFAASRYVPLARLLEEMISSAKVSRRTEQMEAE